MKRSVILFFVALCISCASYKPQIPGYFKNDERLYVNEKAGFTIRIPEEWKVGISPKSAPPAFKTTFKAIQTKSIEALFLGMNDNERAFTRCIVEANDSTLESYFKSIYEVNKNGLSTVRADFYKGKGQELIVWSYSVKISNNELKFVDYIIDLQGLKARFSFWTLSGLFNDYQKNFEDIGRSICISDTTADTSIVCNYAFLAKDSVEEQRVIDYATDKKELYFAEEPQDFCEGLNNACLWKVAGPTSVCYLFGSIHFAKPEMYPLKAIIERAFDSSDYLGVEINSNGKDIEQKSKELIREGMYPTGDMLKNHISPELNKKIEDYLTSKAIPASNLSPFRPWCAVLVLQTMQLQALGYSADYGIDRYFLKKAKLKKILELETFEEQKALLLKMDKESYLDYSMKEITSIEPKINGLISAWKCGNIKLLDEILFRDIDNAVPENAAIMDAVFYKRNIKMAEKVSQYLSAGQKCFIVVGAGHLIGKNSVVDLLEKKGYLLEQL